jgi:hypothetical protein
MAVCTACGSRLEPAVDFRDATADDASDGSGEITDGAAEADVRGPEGICTPKPMPPIDPEPHIDCVGKHCGDACDPCKDPRACVDATRHAFACNWIRRCVEVETD